MAFVHELPHLEDAQPCRTGAGTHRVLTGHSRGTHGVLVRCVWGADGEEGRRLENRSALLWRTPIDSIRSRPHEVLWGTHGVLSRYSVLSDVAVQADDVDILDSCEAPEGYSRGTPRYSRALLHGYARALSCWKTTWHSAVLSGALGYSGVLTET